ncbi:VOC family protein [Chryseolinea sp. H1M3-3]|uniref:VOC family protein n=1 Tax=Chryseolinea sp. H1M3-3 TaxID=3034144 RepID=UPI0023ED285A|nr:VOC family protein [Chryseolinea sp. H1M3-3]
MKIGLTSVFVHNPIEAYKFYTEVLGFVKKMYVPEAYLAIVASPEEPEGTSLLLEPNNNPIAKTYQEGLFASGLPVIVFTAGDIYKEHERLKNKGVVFRKEPTKTDYGIEAIFEDTCGNLIQLHQF